MEILYVTIHLAIISRCLSFDFGSLIKTLPPAFPENFRNKILEMYSKHPEDFGESRSKSGNPGTRIMKIHNNKKSIRKGDKVPDKPVTAAPTQKTTPLFPAPIAMPPIPAMPHMPPMLPMPPVPPMPLPMPPLPISNHQSPMRIPQLLPMRMPPMPPVPPMLPMPLVPPMPRLPISHHQPPMFMPMYPQLPIVLPMRTFYEPVIHHHPPLDRIRQIIKEDEERWEKHKNKKIKRKYKERSREKHSDSSDTSEEKRCDDFQYYDDVIKVKGSHLHRL